MKWNCLVKRRSNSDMILISLTYLRSIWKIKCFFPVFLKVIGLRAWHAHFLFNISINLIRLPLSLDCLLYQNDWKLFCCCFFCHSVKEKSHSSLENRSKHLILIQFKRITFDTGNNKTENGEKKENDVLRRIVVIHCGNKYCSNQSSISNSNVKYFSLNS